MLLPAVAEAARAARSALDVLNEKVPAPAMDDIRLAISEVVTNAVVHGGEDPVEVRVSAADDFVNVVVEDPGRGFGPELVPRPEELQESGWGLYIVDSLSDRWGVTVADGTQVWFEIALGRYERSLGSEQASGE